MTPFTKEQLVFVRTLLNADRDTLFNIVRFYDQFTHFQTSKTTLILRVLVLATEDKSGQKESYRLQQKSFRSLLCERGLAKEEWFQHDVLSSPQTESGSA